MGRIGRFLRDFTKHWKLISALLLGLPLLFVPLEVWFPMQRDLPEWMLPKSIALIIGPFLPYFLLLLVLFMFLVWSVRRIASMG